MILGNPHLFCTGNGNVELWTNLGSYENGAGQEHSDATHIPSSFVQHEAHASSWHKQSRGVSHFD
jgi:hypothetical protein